MEKEHMNIIIVGHVDHGKSTLIGRLLYDTDSLPKERYEEIKEICKELGKDIEFAYIMDHLEEERNQNVTIDTAQIFFKSKKRDYVIIDAPGHIEFVKNMITGASQAKAAILLVDVKEGIKEQTKRHAYILNMLGIKQVIVALNKIDLINYDKDRIKKVEEDILKFLDSLDIKPIKIIPISAKHGENIVTKSNNVRVDETILEALDNLEEKTKEEKLIFPVQDIYKIDDERIYVGRIESGILKKGENLLVLPTNKEVKIDYIKVYGGEKKEARKGESIGLIIDEDFFIDRGYIFCEKKYPPKLTNNIKANIFWISKDDFNLNDKLKLRCVTQEVDCKVEKISKRINSSSLEILEKDSNKLKETEVGEIIIKTDKPVIIENFNKIEEIGRFILLKDNETCAGGIIIE